MLASDKGGHKLSTSGRIELVIFNIRVIFCVFILLYLKLFTFIKSLNNYFFRKGEKSWVMNV